MFLVIVLTVAIVLGATIFGYPLFIKRKLKEAKTQREAEAVKAREKAAEAEALALTKESSWVNEEFERRRQQKQDKEGDAV